MNAEKQQSPEWFEKRKGRITGSRVGAIIGASPFSTKADVMRDMVRDYHGAEREFKGNIATQWGSKNEATAIIEYTLTTGLEVTETGFHPYDAGGAKLGASPDGLVGDDGIVEIKCPFGMKIKTISEQPHYYHQIQLELLSTGRAWCDYVCWTPDDIFIERVPADPFWLDSYGAELAAFYAAYLAIIASDALSEPFIADKEIDKSADLEWRKIEARYLAAVQAEAEAAAKVSELKKELLKLADNKKCFSDSVTVFKTVKNGSIAYAKALKEIAPDADLEAYRGNPSEYWTIKVRGKTC